MSAEIIQFPVKNPRMPDVEAFRTKIEAAFERGSVQQAHAREASELFRAIIVEHLIMAGFDVSRSSTNKDLSLVLESMHAYIMKYYGLHHPLQNFSEEIFFPMPKENKMGLKISKLQRMINKTE